MPGADFNRGAPIVNGTVSWAKAIPTGFSRAPTNFSFPAYASLHAGVEDHLSPVAWKRFGMLEGKQVEQARNKLQKEYNKKCNYNTVIIFCL